MIAKTKMLQTAVVEAKRILLLITSAIMSGTAAVTDMASENGKTTLATDQNSLSARIKQRPIAVIPLLSQMLIAGAIHRIV